MDKLMRFLKEVPWMAFYLVLGGTSTWWLMAMMRGSLTGAIAPSLIMTPFAILATIKLKSQRLQEFKPDPEVALERDVQVGLIALPIAGIALGIWCYNEGAHILGLGIGLAFPLIALLMHIWLHRSSRREQQE